MSKTRAEIRAQYPANETPDKAIVAKLEAAANADKRIACRAAHKIAQDLDCVPLKVGQTADLMEVRIIRCQLGLFSRGEATVAPLSKDDITPEMRAAVESAVSDGKISCKECWQLADQLNLTRLEMGALCDGLKIKVSPCQLGAF